MTSGSGLRLLSARWDSEGAGAYELQCVQSRRLFVTMTAAVVHEYVEMPFSGSNELAASPQCAFTFGLAPLLQQCLRQLSRVLAVVLASPSEPGRQLPHLP